MEFLESSLHEKRLYVVRDHRVALLCWKRAFDEQLIERNAFLVHIDAHTDFTCSDVHADTARSNLQTDDRIAASYVATLNSDNSEFIVPAMIAQFIGDCISIHARECDDYGLRVAGAHETTDKRVFSANGVEHTCYLCKTQQIASLFNYYSYLGMNSEHRDTADAFGGTSKIILDIDLDFFCYKNEQIFAKNSKDIIEQLTSSAFKKLVDKASIITIALEPECCGGTDQCLQILEVMQEYFFKPNGLNALPALREFLKVKPTWKAHETHEMHTAPVGKPAAEGH